MWGIIIGDIIGSEREVLEYKASTKKVSRYKERMDLLKSDSLFTHNSIKTDDTIMSISIMRALTNNLDYYNTLKYDARCEIEKGKNDLGWLKFSRTTCDWAMSDIDYLGYSIGNGAAMRSGGIGLWFDTLEEVEAQARLSAIPTHNTEEGIIGAQSVAASVFLLKNGISKEALAAYLSIRFGYKFNYILSDIQKNNTFDSKAINTVPLAIYAFIVSKNFEDGIRVALSMGGDTDTICAIAGALLEAYYGVDEKLKEEAMKYLTEEDLLVINKFYEIVNKKKKGNTYSYGKNNRDIKK